MIGYVSTSSTIVTARDGDIEVIARRDEVGAIHYDHAWNNRTHEYVRVKSAWAAVVTQGIREMFDLVDTGGELDKF